MIQQLSLVASSFPVSIKVVHSSDVPSTDSSGARTREAVLRRLYTQGQDTVIDVRLLTRCNNLAILGGRGIQNSTQHVG